MLRRTNQTSTPKRTRVAEIGLAAALTVAGVILLASKLLIGG